MRILTIRRRVAYYLRLWATRLDPHYGGYENQVYPNDAHRAIFSNDVLK